MLSAKFIKNLDDFLSGAWPMTSERAWIEDRHMKVYLRKCNRHILGEYRKALDIANVAVVESHQRKGLFSELLKRLTEAARAEGAALYVENVIRASYYPIYRRRGFVKLETLSEEGWPSFVLLEK